MKHAIAVVALLSAAPLVTAAPDMAVKQAALMEMLDAYRQVELHYVDPIDDKKVFADAIGGMLSALDPHSQYLDKDDLDDMEKMKSGAYVGIGVEVEIDAGAIRIQALSPGGAADVGGILPGDIIIAVDGEPVTGLQSNNIGKRMRGAPGTGVQLEVSRAGVREPIKVQLVRAALHSKTVAVQVVKPGLVRVRIAEFGGSTTNDLVASLKALDVNGGPQGLILDLRNDPGGLISAAAGVAATFLGPDAVLFSSRGRMPGTTATVAAGSPAFVDLVRGDALDALPAWTRSVPLTVLVNGASASAAELVTGALQDHGRAKVIGSQTFGKGSIQTIIALSPASAIKLTVARYFTPNGHEIQARGITPDVLISPAFPGAADAGIFLREADLAHHLPSIGGELATAKHPAAEKTSLFGTASDKALASAVALLAPPDGALRALFKPLTKRL
ncbi:MAG: S41 family peptidase [Pseudomonadota bacterium]